MAAVQQEIELVIDDELRDYLPACNDQTYAILESMLLETHGPLDTIKVWRAGNIILDGHRRYEICRKHNLPFKIHYLDPVDRDEAKYWMDRWQACRRNLAVELLAISVVRMAKHLEKKQPGRYKQDIESQVADEINRSTRTVKRLIKQGEALQSLPDDLRDRIVNGEVKASRRDTLELATYDETQQRAIFREIDKTGVSLATMLHGEGNEPEDDETVVIEPEEADEEEATSESELKKDTVSHEAKSVEPPPRPRQAKPPSKPTLDLIKDAQRQLGVFKRVLGKLKAVSEKKWKLLEPYTSDLGEQLAEWAREVR